MRRPKHTMLEKQAKEKAAFKASEIAQAAQRLRDVPVVEAVDAAGEEVALVPAPELEPPPEPEAPTTPLEDRDFTEYE